MIEAKKDKVQEGREGVTTKQDQESGKGPYEEEDGGGRESDAQVVRFEVTEVFISFSPSHPLQCVTIPQI